MHKALQLDCDYNLATIHTSVCNETFRYMAIPVATVKEISAT